MGSDFHRQRGFPSPYFVLVDNLETAENADALVAHLRNLLGVSRAIVTSRKQVRHDFVKAHTLIELTWEDTLFLRKRTNFLRASFIPPSQQRSQKIKVPRCIDFYKDMCHPYLQISLKLGDTHTSW